uniref:Uncharacterized protein n=1 Tax=Oryza barthii TaxID=65489 RepID=A0A0D3F133_9ORYZ
MEENPRNEPTSAPPGAGNMTLYGHTMLYDEHQMIDILHTPAGFEVKNDIIFLNSMIMTSNRFPENYEQMGGETEQGTQVTNRGEISQPLR